MFSVFYVFSFGFSHSSLEKFHSCFHRAWATWGEAAEEDVFYGWVRLSLLSSQISWYHLIYMVLEEFLVCSVCIRVSENRPTLCHDSYTNFAFLVSLSAKKEIFFWKKFISSRTIAMKLWHLHLVRVYLRLGRLTVSVMAWTNWSRGWFWDNQTTEDNM